MDLLDLRKTKLCRYWPRCRKGMWCNFAHGETELAPKKCRFGSACWKYNCIFSHPEKVINQIWKLDPRPINNEEEIQKEVKEVLTKRGLDHVTVSISVYVLS